MEFIGGPAPVWLVILLAFAIVLNIDDAVSRLRSCSCGAPANAQRHASECPWGYQP